MIYSIFRFIFPNSKTHNIILGRWGYHWEINKHVQKYYE
jgi:hypothetical protein